MLTQPPTFRSEVFIPVRRERSASARLRAGSRRGPRSRRRLRPPSRRGALALALALTLALVTGGSVATGRLPWMGGEHSAPTGPAPETEALLEILAANHYRAFDAAPLGDAPVAAWSSILDDPFTRIVPAADIARADKAESAGYVGIGVRLRATKDGSTEIAAVADGSPAFQGGLRPGDVVLAIDGAEVDGLDADAVAAMIDGPEGSVLTVYVDRPGAEVSATIQRGILKQGTVVARLRRWENDLVGVVTVPELIPGAGDEMRAAVDHLADEGATAFVLDLRHNPGGPMSEALDVASAFLPAGSTVATEVGRTRSTETFVTGSGPIEPTAPLVVLVDDLTSGTAEVVAGALSDQGRALVAGAITAGESGLQERYPLPGGDAFQTTYASYVTPLGRVIERNGIPPDVAAPTTPADTAQRPSPDGTGDVALDAALRAAVSHAPDAGGAGSDAATTASDPEPAGS